MGWGIQLILPLDCPLDLACSLESGQAHRWRRRGAWFEGVLFESIVSIRQTSAGLEFDTAPEPAESFLPRLTDYLRLEDDLEEIYDSINVDDHMSRAIDTYRGMRILRQEPWECLVSFICSANSNLPRIGATMETLAQTFGAPVSIDGSLRHTFPTPDQLAEAGERKLRDLGLGFRAKYVARAAEIVAEGRLDLWALREAPYQEARDTLLTLSGVGEKIADCVLLFSLDKLNAFPIDRWVRRALEEWYLHGKTPYSRLKDWSWDYFGPYAGYAQQYLFQGRRLAGAALSRGVSHVTKTSLPKKS